MCMVDLGELVTVLSDSTPRARKPHECNECGRVIDKGEAYRKTAYTFDGDFGASIVCLHCEAGPRTWLMRECSGFVYRQVGEDLEEHWINGNHARSLGRLIVGMRRKWRRRDGRLMPLSEVTA